MFTIVEYDCYGYDRVILRDSLCIIGSFDDSKKELKQLLKQIKTDCNDKIESIEKNEDYFTIIFKLLDEENHKHSYTAQIMKVTM